MAFRDDYPLNPPPIPDDWSQPVDRNQYDSQQESRANILEIAMLVDGLRRMTIPLPDGRLIEVLAMDVGADAALSGAWSLAPAAGGKYRIASPGRVYESYQRMDSDIAIVDIDATFAIGSGDLVYLRLTNPAEPVLTLKWGPKPTEWPQTYKLSTTAVTTVEEAYYGLWEGVVGEMPEGETGIAKDGYWIKRYGRSLDSVLIWGASEVDESATHVPIPVMVAL
jgi:hypothetical protein